MTNDKFFWCTLCYCKIVQMGIIFSVNTRLFRLLTLWRLGKITFTIFRLHFFDCHFSLLTSDISISLCNFNSGLKPVKSDVRSPYLSIWHTTSSYVELICFYIFLGTEALLFHAQSNPSYRGDTEGFPKEVALKIFKKTIHNYKPPPNVYYYLSTSPWKEPSIKDLPRRTINTLAKKEIINLQKVRAAGIHCPQPVMLCRHIVVMSFIGENKKPAPKLKNVILEPDEYLIAYHEVNSLKIYIIQWQNVCNKYYLGLLSMVFHYVSIQISVFI